MLRLEAPATTFLSPGMLGTKSEQEYENAERRRELWEVEHYPEGEKREMLELYLAKGVPLEDAEIVVETLSRHKEAWVDIVMAEELGMVPSSESPMRNALVTFFSFGMFGFVPLLAYVIARLVPYWSVNTFVAACVLTAATLFMLGALKARLTACHWLRSGLETLLVGGVAAAAAYSVGVLLQGLA